MGAPPPRRPLLFPLGGITTLAAWPGSWLPRRWERFAPLAYPLVGADRPTFAVITPLTFRRPPSGASGDAVPVDALAIELLGVHRIEPSARRYRRDALLATGDHTATLICTRRCSPCAAGRAGHASRNRRWTASRRRAVPAAGRSTLYAMLPIDCGRRADAGQPRSDRLAALKEVCKNIVQASRHCAGRARRGGERQRRGAVGAVFSGVMRLNAAVEPVRAAGRPLTVDLVGKRSRWAGFHRAVHLVDLAAGQPLARRRAISGH